ncbi:MAG: hypothetical protein ACE5GC_04235 [Acidimicrobiia bacterium]
MDLALALLAALVATGFAIELAWGYRSRPRPHTAAWAVAFSLYAAATWALVAGLGAGWSDTTFRVFYYFGAIATVPLLALGAVYLVLGDGAGRLTRDFVLIFLAAAAWVTMTAVPGRAIEDVGIPEGSEVFEIPVNEIQGGVTLPSPRLFAAIAGGVGSLTVIGLGTWSIARNLRSDPRRSLGTALIVVGTLAPATGGSLTALGEGEAFALTLLVGVVLLWIGYRVSSGRIATPGA